VQPELGVCSRASRSRARDFYEGETARLIAADMKKHGGHITLEDLKNYLGSASRPKGLRDTAS
jgi:gamma-glutamyltranspeptidase/glutathione hydrolase